MKQGGKGQWGLAGLMRTSSTLGLVQGCPREPYNWRCRQNHREPLSCGSSPCWGLLETAGSLRLPAALLPPALRPSERLPPSASPGQSPRPRTPRASPPFGIPCVSVMTRCLSVSPAGTDAP